ncbi:FMN-binding protein [Myxococcota bacterium]|nr:FMN-binding protein [Myxococcota bacterium]MBU1897168.1 FMN-binding protein [Myxococcota bacterium]
MKDNYIKQAWLVILLGLLYGAGLAGVQLGLSDQIKDNKRNETYAQIPSLVPGAVSDKVEEVTVTVSGKEKKVYKIFDGQGAHLGWVLPAVGGGFADAIELLVGVTADFEQITGLFVLSQKETPGLGDFITDDTLFLNQFRGMPLSKPLKVEKMDASAAAGQVQALTGATISSVAVTDAINKAIKAFGKALKEAAPASIPVAPAPLPVAPAPLPVAPASIPVAPASIPVAPASIPASIPVAPASIPVAPASIPVQPALIPAPIPVQPASIPVAPASIPVQPAPIPASIPVAPAPVKEIP